MAPLRLAAKLYFGVLTLCALSVALALLEDTAALPWSRVVLAIGFAAAMTLAVLYPLPFALNRQLYLETAVILAASFIFAPGVAALVVAIGPLLANVVRRDSWVQAIFNAAQMSLQAVAAALVIGVAGWSHDTPDYAWPAVALLALLAGSAMHFVNTFIVAGMIAMQGRHSWPRTWRGTAFGLDRTELLTHLGQLGIGLLAVIIAETEPWALLLLLIPGPAIFSALQYHAQHRLRAEAALHGSEANLAEAQRIARLGSWEWDLLSGTQRWSNQLYHIVGADPEVDTPSEALLLRTVHPADQAIVAAARARARSHGVSASLDYRLCLPDGGERIVHAQFEAERDGGGTPTRLLGTVHDITDRKVLEARLAHQAFHDGLTGLPNRAHVLDRISVALKRTNHDRPSIAVLFLDLDRFKLINDSFGHEAGDQLLVAVADRLSTCARSGDTVARLGGDEFTVLMEDFGESTVVEAMAARIIDALTAPFTINGREVVITTSIGIVTPDARHDSATAVLRDADVALYHAKDGGRGRFAIFDARMGTVIQERLDVEEELRRAVARNEFTLLYQPKIELATSRVVGVEALLRWRHPRRGLVRPALFLDIAEETSLILPIGSWVLETACRQARVWQDTLPIPPVVSVNVSARQLQMLGLVEEIEGYMTAFGLTPGRLRLEISEAVAMADAEATIGILWRLQRIGVSVMIDDFGTGYSSLSHLGRFPVDTLHLDHSFVAGLGRTREAGAIAQAVIDLARALGLHVVAEGIERDEQLRVLLALGCELGQGDLFSPPVPPERITTLLGGSGTDAIPERERTTRPPLATPSPSHAGAS